MLVYVAVWDELSHIHRVNVEYSAKRSRTHQLILEQMTRARESDNGVCCKLAFLYKCVPGRIRGTPEDAYDADTVLSGGHGVLVMFGCWGKL